MKNIILSLFLCTPLSAFVYSGEKEINFDKTTFKCIDKHIDALGNLVFAIATQIYHDYFMEKEERLSFKYNATYTALGFISGELLETVYGKVFEAFSHKSLRQALGKSAILGLELDNKRLLRRVVSVITIIIALKLTNGVPSFKGDDFQ